MPSTIFVAATFLDFVVAGEPGVSLAFTRGAFFFPGTTASVAERDGARVAAALVVRVDMINASKDRIRLELRS